MQRCFQYLREAASLCRCVLDHVIHFRNGRDLQLRSVLSNLLGASAELRPDGVTAGSRGLLVQARTSEKRHIETECRG